MATRKKTRRRKVRLQTPRQEKFISLCAALGNRTQAYILAGYRSKFPTQDAAKLAKRPYIFGRIREAIDAQVGGKPGLESRLAQVADANLKDFEPWLEGRATLRSLARKGVNVGVIESAVIHTGKEGETRKLRLYSKLDATWKLVRMGGYGEGGRDPDEPKPAEVHVTVDMGHIVSDRLKGLPERPSAPGLPGAANRFAEQTTVPACRDPGAPGAPDRRVAVATAVPQAEGERPAKEKT